MAPPPLSDKSGGMLLGMFQDIYKLELAAEEDVHRTLPFFATALGLIVTALVFAVGHLPSWPALTAKCPASTAIDLDWFACRWSILLPDVFLAAAFCCSFLVLGYLAVATERKDYGRLGETKLLNRAHALQALHSKLGLDGSELDSAVATSLRVELIQDYALIISLNRAFTLQRYHLRARAVSFLLGSLFAAVVVTIFLIVTTELKVTP
jgi:hypothetical protein